MPGTNRVADGHGFSDVFGNFIDGYGFLAVIAPKSRRARMASFSFYPTHPNVGIVLLKINSCFGFGWKFYYNNSIPCSRMTMADSGHFDFGLSLLGQLETLTEQICAPAKGLYSNLVDLH